MRTSLAETIAQTDAPTALGNDPIRGLTEVQYAALLCVLGKSPEGITVIHGHLHQRERDAAVVRSGDELKSHLSTLKPDQRSAALQRLREIARDSLGDIEDVV